MTKRLIACFRLVAAACLISAVGGIHLCGAAPTPAGLGTHRSVRPPASSAVVRLVSFVSVESNRPGVPLTASLITALGERQGKGAPAPEDDTAGLPPVSPARRLLLRGILAALVLTFCGLLAAMVFLHRAHRRAHRRLWRPWKKED